MTLSTVKCYLASAVCHFNGVTYSLSVVTLTVLNACGYWDHSAPTEWHTHGTSLLSKFWRTRSKRQTSTGCSLPFPLGDSSGCWGLSAFLDCPMTGSLPSLPLWLQHLLLCVLCQSQMSFRLFPVRTKVMGCRSHSRIFFSMFIFIGACLQYTRITFLWGTDAHT